RSLVAFTRGANAALGQTQDWSLHGLGREVAGSYLTLGAMRLTGALGESWYGRVRGTASMGAESFDPLRTLTSQASMLGGIYLGHALETRAGLREQVDGATTLLDSLAMLAQFHVGGQLMHHAFGPGFERLNQELQLRSEFIGRGPSSHPESLEFPWHQDLLPAMAGIHLESPAEIETPAWNETNSREVQNSNIHMTVGDESNGGGNGN